ncbi:MAG: MFS transporter [Thaumarchaeota archaeon]|nr:MFS transporter [Nitrososphaerota archaeon]
MGNGNDSVSLKYLILSFYLPSFFLSLGMGIVNPILPLFARTFDVTFSVAALVVTATGVGRLLIAIPSGIAMDRIGRRPIILIGAALAVVSGLLSGLTQNFLQLLFYRVLTGVSMGMWIGARQTMIADSVRSSIRGKVMSTFMISSTLGLAAGPAMGGFIAELLGFRAPFFIYALVSAISLMLSLFLIRETMPERSASQDRSRKGILGFDGDMTKALLSISFVSLAFVTTVSHIRMGAYQVLIPFFGNYSLNFGLVEIGLLLSILAIFLILIATPAGMIMDRYGRKKALVPSMIVSALGIFMFPFVIDLPQAILVSVVMGIGVGLGAGAVATIAADMAPKRSRGLYMSVWRMMGAAGGLIGPVMAGAIIDLYTMEMAFFAVAILLVIAAVVSQVFMKETLQKGDGKGGMFDPLNEN